VVAELHRVDWIHIPAQRLQRENCSLVPYCSRDDTGLDRKDPPRGNHDGEKKKTKKIEKNIVQSRNSEPQLEPELETRSRFTSIADFGLSPRSC
jgi:glutaredoxin